MHNGTDVIFTVLLGGASKTDGLLRDTLVTVVLTKGVQTVLIKGIVVHAVLQAGVTLALVKFWDFFATDSVFTGMVTMDVLLLHSITAATLLVGTVTTELLLLGGMGVNTALSLGTVKTDVFLQGNGPTAVLLLVDKDVTDALFLGVCPATTLTVDADCAGCVALMGCDTESTSFEGKLAESVGSTGNMA